MSDLKSELLQKAVKMAANRGCIKGIMLCKSLGVPHLGKALRAAAFSGRSDIATACLSLNPCSGGKVSGEGVATRMHVPVYAHFLIETIKEAAKRKHRNVVGSCISYARKMGAEIALSPDDWAQIHGYEKKCDAMPITDSVIETIDERCWKTILFGKEACKGMDCDHSKLRGEIDGEFPSAFHILVYEAVCDGNSSILKECRQQYPIGYNSAIYGALREATRRGCIKTIKMCREWGACSFSEAAAIAAFMGYARILKLFKLWEGLNLNCILTSAARGGNIEIMKMCFSWRARCYDKALFWAAHSGSIEAMELCESHGAVNYEEAFTSACAQGHREAAMWCMKKAGMDM